MAALSLPYQPHFSRSTNKFRKKNVRNIAIEVKIFIPAYSRYVYHILRIRIKIELYEDHRSEGVST